jgi:menaquinone reductase, multiheme cytochrome c subunit
MVKHRGTLTFVLGFVAALAGGWLALPHALYQRIEQPVQFSHLTHSEEAIGMACADCHSLEPGGRFTGIPPLEQCAGCHSEPLGESAAEKLFVDDYVATGREVPWLVYARQPENVYFSHAPHIGLAGIECQRCHGDHGISAALPPLERNRISTYSRAIEGRSIVRVGRNRTDGMKMNDCSHCHRERGVVESCLTCHK